MGGPLHLVDVELIELPSDAEELGQVDRFVGDVPYR